MWKATAINMEIPCLIPAIIVLFCIQVVTIEENSLTNLLWISDKVGIGLFLL